MFSSLNPGLLIRVAASTIIYSGLMTQTVFGAPVSSTPRGYWGSGVLVGHKGDVVTRGLLFSTKEMTIQVGANHSANGKHYPSETLKVSTYDQFVYDQLQSVPFDQPVVLRYVHPYPLNPFHLTESKYFITSVQLAGQSFEQTESYRQYGYRFDNPSGEQRGSYEAGQKSGQFIHVSRWGLVFGKTCTAYLHEGGTKQVTTTVPQSGMASVTNPATGQSELLAVDSYQVDTMTVPNVTVVNIYSEAGCRYAEDLTVSMMPVLVEHSGKLFEIWNAHDLTIHGMTAKPELRQL
ncbi:hypothetical protein [Endozoicomonas ascidiicola]|uniref:hypothetical protein n=1 Tax=Endozoicomonas ascidiicola TaxID=1698521 RepID=UPI00082DCCF7|nr:hypothetical protein [Endozoicomonas ascidiicola]